MSNKLELIEMFDKKDIKSLDDLYTIENVAMGIKQLNKKLDFLEEYKKRKVKSIGDETNRIKEKISFYKEVIIKTLQEHKEKTLSFPGSCKVTKRKTPDKWIINDEEAFREVLKGTPEEEQIVQEMVQYIIDKKVANKVLKAWDASGKIEDVKESVEKKIGGMSVSIQYDKKENVGDEDVEEDIPVKEKKPDYDSLDF